VIFSSWSASLKEVEDGTFNFGNFRLMCFGESTFAGSPSLTILAFRLCLSVVVGLFVVFVACTARFLRAIIFQADRFGKAIGEVAASYT
jgi:hypothetical protein